VRVQGRKEREEKERGRGPGVSGPRGRKKGAGEKDFWLGRAAKREEGEGREQAGRAGPKGEKREGKERRNKANVFEFENET
jgi:hypothetical protein